MTLYLCMIFCLYGWIDCFVADCAAYSVISTSWLGGFLWNSGIDETVLLYAERNRIGLDIDRQIEFPLKQRDIP